MGSQLFPDFENAPRSGMHLVTSKTGAVELLAFEVPKYAADTLEERQGSLGCVRGVAWAFCIQAVFVIIIAGLWEVWHMVR